MHQAKMEGQEAAIISRSHESTLVLSLRYRGCPYYKGRGHAYIRTRQTLNTKNAHKEHTEENNAPTHAGFYTQYVGTIF